METDVRWRQRFHNYQKALSQLGKFIQKSDSLSEMETQGLIKAFEYTYELSWNLIKDYYEYQGVGDIHGSRDAFRMAYRQSLITDGEAWMKMIESRIQTAHTYNEETAEAVVSEIVRTYYRLFMALETKMADIRRSEDNLTADTP